MPGLKHTHQYRRAVGRKTKNNADSKMVNYYKCMLPGCTHYVRDFMILGKESICNRCGNRFTLPTSLRFLGNIPHCKKCTKKYVRKADLEQALDEAIEEALDIEDEEIQV